MSNVTLSVYFDNRKPSKSGTYAVVLKVYHDKAARFFPVFHNHARLKLSEADFKSSYEAVKPKNKHREYKTAIEACYKRATDIIDGLEPFTFNGFELAYMGNTKTKTDLPALYETIIIENEEQGRIKNAEAYQTSLRSLLQFFSYRRRKQIANLAYGEITPAVLHEYEHFITEVEIVEQGKVIKRKGSISTVGSYTRALRAVFNRAIDEGYINKSLYPFGNGKSKYQIPAGRKVKRGLNREQVKQLYEIDLSQNDKAAKARDFWMLSYVCNGMQFKDLAYLQYKNIYGDFFHFVRHKTKNTTKSNQTPIIVPITDHVRFMIDKYGNKEQPDAYIFPILEPGMTAREQTRNISNFTRFVSQNLKNTAERLGISGNLANMVARHTFATSIIRSGKPIEYAQKAMGHQSKTTTDAYFAGFEDYEIMKVNTELLNFESD